MATTVLRNALGGMSTPAEEERKLRYIEERKRDMKIFLQQQAKQNPRLARLNKAREAAEDAPSKSPEIPDVRYSDVKHESQQRQFQDQIQAQAPASNLYYNPHYNMPNINPVSPFYPSNRQIYAPFFQPPVMS